MRRRTRKKLINNLSIIAILLFIAWSYSSLTTNVDGSLTYIDENNNIVKMDTQNGNDINLSSVKGMLKDKTKIKHLVSQSKNMDYKDELNKFKKYLEDVDY